MLFANPVTTDMTAQQVTRVRHMRLAVVLIAITLVVAVFAAACRPTGFRPETLRPEDVPADLRAAFLASPVAEGTNHAWHAFGTSSAGTILAATWTHRAPVDGKLSRMWGIALWDSDLGVSSQGAPDYRLTGALETDKVFDALTGQGGLGEGRFLVAGGYALSGEAEEVVVSTTLGLEVTTDLCDGWWMVLIKSAEAREELTAIKVLDRNGKILHAYPSVSAVTK